MNQDPTDNLIGQVINNFEVQELIGKGGMGIVYRAYHPDIQRYAALKVMRPSLAGQPGFYERFLQEARTAARLEHPNIVDVINFGRYEGSYYLMMDYIDGPSLRALINEHKQGLPLWDAIQTAWQIADVLVYSHAAGVLHRDLKPDNILLTHSVRANRPYRVIVTDFGLVKLGQGSLLETQEGISVGTPAYMSPEQCQGKDVDGRTDVYALGVMLYEMVTGRRPYPIRSLYDAIKFHSSGKLVAPRALNSSIPIKLDTLIRRMLIPELSERLPSAAEATDELHELILELGETQETPSDITARVASVSPQPAAKTEEEESSPTLTPPDSTAQEFYVQVAYHGQWDEKAYPLGQKPLMAGRLPTSDIMLDRPGERYVSKRHCEIRVEQGRVFVRDLGSTNGTILGNERLQPNVLYEWKPSAEVQLGPFALALKTGEALRDVPSPPVEAVPSLPATQVNSSFKVSCPKAVPSRLPLIPERPIIIGRADDCDMVLSSPHVSKQHCRIQLGMEGPEIVDLRSTNGTYLGNQRLPANTPIAWQDEPAIAVGPFFITLEDKSA
jgi:serine/threonine protein kinase